MGVGNFRILKSKTSKFLISSQVINTATFLIVYSYSTVEIKSRHINFS